MGFVAPHSRRGICHVAGIFLVLGCSLVSLVAQHPEEGLVRGTGVELRASVSLDSPRVTLHWRASHFPSTGLTVYRRVVGTIPWGPGVSLSPSALSYADPSAQSNTLYEYRVVRTQDSESFPVVEGHLWSGVEVPVVDQRGRLILVVDEMISTPLAAEIDRLIDDLIGDGWEVVRTDVSRSGTPRQVWEAIHGWYAVDAANTKAVFLLGHVPVPYSGNICPDGHYDAPPEAHHRGAWPADVFYGDMDGEWTDHLVNQTLANVDGARNHNVPGDGKFDPSLLLGDLLPELAVGRVDLSDLEEIGQGATEVDLLRRYLDRHHAFRHRLAPFTTLGERALVDDHFGNAFDAGFAASGWSSGVALFGPAQTTAQEWVPALQAQDYLLAYGCGPGSFGGAMGVSEIADFRDTPCRAVFNLLFGSFFGDWDSADNYLRAPLAARAESHGLVSLWSGNPRWQLFPLAAGGTLADAYHHVLREVNDTRGFLPPSDESWTNPDQTHPAIMGDPVLRSHPVKPVTNLSVMVNHQEVTLAWTLPSGEADLGCRVYRSADAAGPFALVGSQTATGATQFTDTVPSGGTWHYRVRLIKRQTTASASYHNPAQGIAVSATVASFAYHAWAAGLPDASPTADPNGDGISNLLAYAVGATSGHANAVFSMPRVNPDGSFLIPHSGRTDVDYAAELSHDLAVWYPVARRPAGGSWSLNAASGYPQQGQLALTGGEARLLRDSSLAQRRFWRLSVSL